MVDLRLSFLSHDYFVGNEKACFHFFALVRLFAFGATHTFCTSKTDFFVVF